MSNKFVPSKGLSLLKCKCPQCQSGQMFPHSAFNIQHFMKMNEECPVCGLHFEIEPGFFWGAMYVSYALTVGVMLTVGAGILIFSGGKAEFYTYIIPIISTLVLASPLTYRYARVLMLYWFSPIHFVKELANKSEN